jgi:hypothetical protein
MDNPAMQRVHPFAEQGNWTAVHNSVFDVMMPELPPNAFKVLCFVIRKTRGWKKDSDQLSYTQIAAGTGIKSPSTLREALKSLGERGYILASSKSKWDATSYRLNTALEIEVPTTEIEVDKPTTEIVVATKTVVATTTKTVALPTTISVDTKERSKERERGGERTPHTPAVQAYFETYPSQTLDADQMTEINRTVIDLPKWQDVLRYWKMSGYRAQSIPKMLDRYLSGATVTSDRPGGARVAATTPHVPTYELATDTRTELSADQRRAIMARRKDT